VKRCRFQHGTLADIRGAARVRGVAQLKSMRRRFLTAELSDEELNGSHRRAWTRVTIIFNKLLDPK